MLKFRKAILEDSEVYFNWTNDQDVRSQSFNSNEILWETHNSWFLKKINDSSCSMLIFNDIENNNIGQVRIEKCNDNNALIGISIAREHRGNGYAKEILALASDYFLSENSKFCIHAYIKEQNLSSKYAFEKAGFEFSEMMIYKNYMTFHYIKKNK